MMSQAGIRSILKKKFVVTTNSSNTARRFDNLLNRDFAPVETGRVWVNDITYIATRQ